MFSVERLPRTSPSRKREPGVIMGANEAASPGVYRAVGLFVVRVTKGQCLPPFCIRCGEPTSETVEYTKVASPWNVLPLLGAIGFVAPPLVFDFLAWTVLLPFQLSGLASRCHSCSVTNAFFRKWQSPIARSTGTVTKRCGRSDSYFCAAAPWHQLFW
jgi:hypothetical protein